MRHGFARLLRAMMLLAPACLLSGAALAADRVRLGLAIPPTVTDGGVYALAEELGFLREEGIELELVTLSGAGAILPQLLQRTITLGHPLPETLLAAHKPGEAPLPVVYVYNASPTNTLQLAVLAGSEIRTIADLRGRAIGVGALTWGTIPQTRALLRSVGLEPGRDVSIVAVGVLGAGFHALREGRVQALNFNSTWIDLMEQQGTPARRLEYPPVFRRMVTNGFLAHRATLEGNRGLLERFGRAWTKALAACDANTQRCVEAFWRRNPQARPDGDAAKVMADTQAIVRNWLDQMLRDEAGAPRVPGQFDLGVIRAYVEQMHRWGEFATADIPVETYFTNALVPAFSAFDRQAVAARAQASR